jgi:hypothetical protein
LKFARVISANNPSLESASCAASRCPRSQTGRPHARLFADGLECSVKVRHVRDDGGHAKCPRRFPAAFSTASAKTIKIAVNAPDFTSGEVRESYPAGSRGRRSSANALSFHGSCRRTAREMADKLAAMFERGTTCCSERMAILKLL